MGFLKDMRAFKQLADATPRPGLRSTLRDGLAVANHTMADAQRAQHLAVNGLAGSATITSVRDTGTTINEHPLVELGLDVTLDGRPPYAVTHTQLISRLAAPGFTPGATVPVRVDPADPTSVMVA
ncbi:DUF3592 domain-containing protein [Solirubrobacter phytolaccae]|uniref:DUF3592 domain-containing protein n=1 Tax=Solirubrobacter phytolaccae TaxID=1404360 RepID=A0A9X3N9V1_9ACTN|nr:DUF3592 domain-containing protein [Solirubrobacter phytolaccae]MDA0181074.1 DUF3592 domain-containing protein [Solirubrobacter phytolaccae]